MLKPLLEKTVDDFANTEDLGKAIEILLKGLSEKLNDGKPVELNHKSYILIGHDTRVSSPHLAGLMEYRKK
jgi:hypothetical protein